MAADYLFNLQIFEQPTEMSCILKGIIKAGDHGDAGNKRLAAFDEQSKIIQDLEVVQSRHWPGAWQSHNA